MEEIYKEHVISKGGNFVTTENPIEFEKLLLKENLPIKGLEHIKIGDKTDLYGWFTEPIEYKGILAEMGHRALIFLLGEDEDDLFKTKKTTYYDLTYIIGKCNDRIGKCYKAGTFRDVFLKKDKNNNYYWK